MGTVTLCPADLLGSPFPQGRACSLEPAGAALVADCHGAGIRLLRLPWLGLSLLELEGSVLHPVTAALPRNSVGGHPAEPSAVNFPRLSVWNFRLPQPPSPGPYLPISC